MSHQDIPHPQAGLISPPRPTVAWAALTVCIAAFAGATATGNPPQSLDDRYVIEPVTDTTSVVTPVGCTHDHRGRLLVIESHTHQRPEGYEGPPHDRIRLVEDTDGDGRADRFRTFHEDTRATMGIRRGPGDWIYVATRSEVFRMRDADGDDVAEHREPILRLETEGDYPHNGLGGLAFDDDGSLVVGLGENLGAPYRLVAADGSAWSGGAEGGSVFSCSATGGGLSRVATGFWNPFGLAFDPVGRLFAVDNDPDARPPCRLIDVVSTGDYGYRFRYGRSGRHPLQCWDGELAGTLPMAAGTGEAPCNVVPYDGGLWVTSWGHNRLEVFTPEPHGATCRARSRIVVQGDQEFRPVDASPAPDGSLLITDWVDRSYPVHGRGRLWRLRVVRGSPLTGRNGWPSVSEGEQLPRQHAICSPAIHLSHHAPQAHQLLPTRPKPQAVPPWTTRPPGLLGSAPAAMRRLAGGSSLAVVGHDAVNATRLVAAVRPSAPSSRASRGGWAAAGFSSRSCNPPVRSAPPSSPTP